ncbi:MAG: hypothetical protein QXG10_01065 [Candidatus Hadarchaeales archaeon]
MRIIRCPVEFKEEERMLIKLVLELEDTPGQLLKALEPISRHGGNVRSIMHDREQKTPTGRLPVTLAFDIANRALLGKILCDLEKTGIRVIQIGEKPAVRKTVLLIGHIIHTDVRDTIDRLNRVKGVMVSDLDLEMGGPSRESAAAITISASDETTAEKAISILGNISEKKGLLMLTSLE